jgi:hypothetical protein
MKSYRFAIINKCEPGTVAAFVALLMKLIKKCCGMQWLMNIFQNMKNPTHVAIDNVINVIKSALNIKSE